MEKEAFLRINGVMDALRGENGCSWDKKQTLQSLRKMFLEEAYELEEALEKEDLGSILEEGGDLLMLLSLMMKILSEKNLSNFDSLDKAITEKMIERHPHVFSESKTLSDDEVLKQWDSFKGYDKEKMRVPSGVPSVSSIKIGKKMAEAGFEWDSPMEVLRQIREETDELEEAIKVANNQDHISEELGDLYFSLHQLARKLELNPDEVSKKANQKFVKRINRILETNKLTMSEFAKIEKGEKEDLWKKSKLLEKT